MKRRAKPGRKKISESEKSMPVTIYMPASHIETLGGIVMLRTTLLDFTKNKVTEATKTI